MTDSLKKIMFIIESTIGVRRDNILFNPLIDLRSPAFSLIAIISASLLYGNLTSNRFGTFPWNIEDDLHVDSSRHSDFFRTSYSN